MTWTTKAAVAAAATGVAAVAVRGIRAARRRGSLADGRDATRWHAVTVNRPAEEVTPGGRLPDPVARLGEAVEVRVRPAPGGKGTEIAVRLTEGEPSGLAGFTARFGGRDPRHAVRAALRESKQLLETGEVLAPNHPPSNRRTALNRPLEYAIRHGRQEGLL
jgi:hypothetical protein